MSTELRAVEHEDGHVTYYVGDLRCWSITGALRAAGKQKSFDGVPTFYRDRGKAVARAIEPSAAFMARVDASMRRAKRFRAQQKAIMG